MKSVVAFGALVCLAAASPQVAARRPPASPQVAARRPPASPQAAVRVERAVYVMGTRARLVADAVDRTAGLARLERMVRTLEETEAELSTWREDSALSALNRQPVAVPWAAPGKLCALLSELEGWHGETGGAFDPAVGPLISVWGLRTGGRQPTPRELQAATARAGFRHLSIDLERCSVVRRADVTVDAGAFGKGEALRRVLELDDGRAGSWLVDLGGQVAVAGVAPGEAWAVAVAHPMRRDHPVVDLSLSRGSLATSGGSERDLTFGGARVGHILDPRTGSTVVRCASVSVWHDDPLAADVLSTSLYVMGVEAGLAWAEARGIAASFIVPADGVDGDAGSDTVTVRSTTAFRQRFQR